MMVSSDEEDEVEEIKSIEKMGKVSSPRANEKSPVTDDSDDVCVVDEISHKKYPRGLVLGPQRTRDPNGLHISNIRRRKRTETNSTVKYVTIRRNITSSSFRNSCSSVLRRKLFCVGEAVRLEERRRYKQLIQAIAGYGMIVASYIIFISNLISPHLWQPFQNFQFNRNPKTDQLPNTPTRLAIGNKPPTVECVDLDSDSDNDVVEVPQGTKATKEDVQMKSAKEIAGNDDVIDLEQEPENPCSSLQTVLDQRFPEYEASTSSAHSQKIPNAEYMFINLVDDDDEEEEEKEEDSEKVTAEPYTSENKQKGNLSDQMIQQMIINDDDDDHVHVEKEISEEEEDSEDDLEESLPEITREMQVVVQMAFTSKPNEVLVNAFNLTVHGKDIQTLKGNNWLNDQVINFYMSLITERGKLGSYPSVYCFNTFFFVKLKSSGHASLKRWTRTVDLFSYDILIIPIHMKVHWCLAAVNFIEKRIEYYDSMHDNNNNDDCGQTLLKYLQDEHLDKKKKEFNTAGWEVVNCKDIPEQLNGCDCGVFACTYAEYICRLTKLTFSQEHMPYFRVKMAYEILTKKLLL
ncbi:hypothetical protein R5R35_012561 [Gryllus longicercus]|uniref:Ubiquitin-like protease family profile domain-containing protein n=2 Tax=Gryllus longicercus TaxID=2509291 RepID=A0AAN9V938_9ORTH